MFRINGEPLFLSLSEETYSVTVDKFAKYANDGEEILMVTLKFETTLGKRIIRKLET